MVDRIFEDSTLGISAPATFFYSFENGSEKSQPIIISCSCDDLTDVGIETYLFPYQLNSVDVEQEEEVFDEKRQEKLKNVSLPAKVNRSFEKTS